MHYNRSTFITAIITVTFFIVVFAAFTVLVVLNNIQRKRKFLMEQKNRESAFREEMLHAQLEMQEHTFRTISQEIHDNVGQILGIVKLNLNILTADPSAQQHLFYLKEQVNQAITELRNLSNGYFGEQLAVTGLHDAVRNQLQHLERTGLFSISFVSEINGMQIDANKTIFLYRMVQESLNNIVKHASANHIDVQLLYREDRIHILIADNGKGFDDEEGIFSRGIGLRSIRQRAEMIHATVAVNSVVNKGTAIHLTCKPDGT
jgi:signal transduction histidine kinase